MRSANFAFVLIGFETGSERLMTMIKKGETVRQVAEGTAAAKQAGFIVGGQFILGFPTETRAESWLTVKQALRLPIDSVRFNLLVPYPGTEVFEMVKGDAGCGNEDWSCYATHAGLTGKRAPYVAKGRTQLDLVLFQWLGHLLFYLRPGQLMNLHNLQYATAGQVRIPEARTLRGCLELAGFGWRLACHMMRKIFARVGTA